MIDAVFILPLAGLLILAPLCALLGPSIINFRMAYFSDAVSHSIFSGVALGLLLGLSPEITVIFFALLMALLISRLERQNSQSLDTVVGCVQAMVVAFGLTILSGRQSLSQTLPQFLFGDVLTITKFEIIELGLLLVVVAGYHAFFGNRLLALSLHQELAMAHGVSRRHRLIHDMLLALSVACGVRLVGIFLITALLVVPAAAAGNLAANQRQFIGWNLAIAVTSVLLGFAGALHFNCGVAAAVIMVASMAYVFSVLTRRFKVASVGSILIGIILTGQVWAATSSAPISAKDILDRIDDLWRGTSSQSIFRMEIQTAHTKRHLKMRNTSLGKDYTLVIIESPEKEKGTATLKVENNIWNYLPKTDRVIKLPPSMLLSQWMGSHFTNDDLVKDSRLADDYDYTISFAGKRDNQEIYELTLVPKPRVAVVWGKIIVTARKADFMPINQYFYDEKGGLAREGHFEDYRIMDGKLIPVKMTMVPKDKPNEYTTVVTETIDFDVKLDKSFFSIQQLKRP